MDVTARSWVLLQTDAKAFSADKKIAIVINGGPIHFKLDYRR